MDVSLIERMHPTGLCSRRPADVLRTTNDLFKEPQIVAHGNRLDLMLLKIASYVSRVPSAGKLISIRTVRAMSPFAFKEGCSPSVFVVFCAAAAAGLFEAFFAPVAEVVLAF